MRQRIRHSFGNAAEAFIADKLPQERRGKAVERIFRATFVAVWRDRPISEITTMDVLQVINPQETHRAGDGPRADDRHQAVFRLGDRRACLRADCLAVRPAQDRKDHRAVAVAQPPPHRPGIVCALAGHRTDG